MKQENKTMKYDKPEVVKVANAVYAIQGEVKADISFADNDPDPVYHTTSAYVADE
jgi:hypothetical protein